MNNQRPTLWENLLIGGILSILVILITARILDISAYKGNTLVIAIGITILALVGIIIRHMIVKRRRFK